MCSLGKFGSVAFSFQEAPGTLLAFHLSGHKQTLSAVGRESVQSASSRGESIGWWWISEMLSCLLPGLEPGFHFSLHLFPFHLLG